MPVINPEFIEQQIVNGIFTLARQRIENGQAQPRQGVDWARFSTWSLPCEEVLDTQHDDDWLDAILIELNRRGLNWQLIDELRRFVWRTAGWLNFDRMLWDWVHLDEKDITRALDWQHRDGIISKAEYQQGLQQLSSIK